MDECNLVWEIAAGGMRFFYSWTVTEGVLSP